MRSEVCHKTAADSAPGISDHGIVTKSLPAGMLFAADIIVLLPLNWILTAAPRADSIQKATPSPLFRKFCLETTS